MDESLVKRMITSIECGACGQHYTEDNIDVIERNEEVWFLRVFCSSCHVRCLVVAFIRGNDKVEVVTDLTKAELDKFKDMDAVSMDDMLDMHNFLKDFSGSLHCLFPR
jgi:hypothetical protein